MLEMRTNTRRFGYLPAAVLAASVILALTGCTGGQAPSGTSPAISTPSAQDSRTTHGPSARAPQPGADIPTIIENIQPSVVTIFTGDGLGSGVVYTADGLILTNEHVVHGNTNVEVAFADGQRVPGRVRASDAISDLALVEAQRKDLPAAKFQKDLPRIGELAIVIGSPLGFENTATSGIISGLHRQIPGSAASSQSLVDLIQTDAAISPGNSGGAVVNSRGEVVGISEAYIPPQAGAVALGFAIPAGTAVRVAEQLLTHGKAEHSFIGLSPADITAQIAEQLHLPDTAGVLVLSTVRNGPADKAGLRAGDVLLSLEGQKLNAPEDLLAALRSKSPGQTVNIEYRRNTDTREAKLTLSERPTGEG
jgi:S1-C subfamily serine protease